MPYEPNYKTTEGSISGGETLGRCKQCGAPVTMMNVVKGPTGLFCSDVCKAKHEQFVRAAAETAPAERAAGGLFFARVRRLLGSLVFLMILVFVVGFIAQIAGFPIPYLTPLFLRMWGFLAGLAG